MLFIGNRGKRRGSRISGQMSIFPANNSHTLSSGKDFFAIWPIPRKPDNEGRRDCEGPVNPKFPLDDSWSLPVQSWNGEESSEESSRQEDHRHQGDGLHRCTVFLSCVGNGEAQSGIFSGDEVEKL